MQFSTFGIRSEQDLTLTFPRNKLEPEEDSSDDEEEEEEEEEEGGLDEEGLVKPKRRATNLQEAKEQLVYVIKKTSRLGGVETPEGCE
jgi:hypothetical protein